MKSPVTKPEIELYYKLFVNNKIHTITQMVYKQSLYNIEFLVEILVQQDISY